MQTICKNEDEGKYSRGTSAVGVIICAERAGGCLERKCDGRIGGRGNRV